MSGFPAQREDPQAERVSVPGSAGRPTAEPQIRGRGLGTELHAAGAAAVTGSQATDASVAFHSLQGAPGSL